MGGELLALRDGLRRGTAALGRCGPAVRRPRVRSSPWVSRWLGRLRRARMRAAVRDGRSSVALGRAVGWRSAPGSRLRRPAGAGPGRGLRPRPEPLRRRSRRRRAAASWAVPPAGLGPRAGVGCGRAGRPGGGRLRAHRPRVRRRADLGSRRPAAPKRSPLTGARLLAWTGGAVTLLGVVLLLALAASRGWFTPPARVAFGAVLGAGLVGLGMWLHRREAARAGALALVATGFATLYLVDAAATAVFGYLPALPALLLALVIAGAGLGLADRWRTQLLAGGVVVGAAVARPGPRRRLAPRRAGPRAPARRPAGRAAQAVGGADAAGRGRTRPVRDARGRRRGRVLAVVGVAAAVLVVALVHRGARPSADPGHARICTASCGLRRALPRTCGRSGGRRRSSAR